LPWICIVSATRQGRMQHKPINAEVINTLKQTKQNTICCSTNGVFRRK